MLSFLPLFAAAFSAVAAFFLGKHRKKQGCEIPEIFLYLTFVLPFAAGGFHTYVSGVTVVCLVIHLLTTAKKQGYLRLTLNGSSIAVLLVALGYCITPLWAADKGMAVFGVARYLPLLLYILALMQLTAEQKEECLGLIPISGSAMTVFSCLLLLIPGTEACLTVSGRLAGFLQYPNTYAAFLLAGLVLQYSKENRNKHDILVDAILVLGILLSGSKTGFVLLVAAAMGIAVIRKQKKTLLILAGLFAGAILLALLLSNFHALQYAGRFQNIRITSNSFLLRLLYYKDVLPMILKKPFGCGYLGYRALQGTFQTGRYHVTYIHNGFLQLLFEIGWLPAFAMAAVFLRGMFSGKISAGKRLLLFILLAHCMLDFDLQFFVFWVILLACLDFETGRQWKLRGRKRAGVMVASGCLVLCLWLAAADFCYSIGKTDVCLRLVPVHTDALCVNLRGTSDPRELNELADAILERNPTCSLAYSAKANAALSQGDVLLMMAYKEQAIRCSPYTGEEYADYFDKLYAVMQLYRQNGDAQSAEYCWNKIQVLSEQIASLQNAADPLTARIGGDAALILPVRHRALQSLLRKQAQQHK